jgi:hypothetical protein
MSEDLSTKTFKLLYKILQTHTIKYFETIQGVGNIDKFHLHVCKKIQVLLNYLQKNVP